MRPLAEQVVFGMHWPGRRSLAPLVVAAGPREGGQAAAAPFERRGCHRWS